MIHQFLSTLLLAAVALLATGCSLKPDLIYPLGATAPLEASQIATDLLLRSAR